MDIKIIKVYEYMGSLRVEVEHEYGEDNIGLSLQAKFLDPETGEPKWKKEVLELITKKYGTRDEQKIVPKTEVFKEFHNTTITMGE